MDTFRTFDNEIPTLVTRITESYRSLGATHHLGCCHVLSRSEAAEIIELMLSILFPGYHGRQDLTLNNVSYHVGELLMQVARKLHSQIARGLAYRDELNGRQTDCQACDQQACETTLAFLRQIPDLREMLAGDVQSAYDGDPAAVNTDETLLAYPGVLAITVYRIAHALHQLDTPLLPRMMTEYAHSSTGIDIHPGAKIGRSFFIDHGTGVVIGETTEIGDNVKLYQGVTLGALSFPKDERGKLIRGEKRHPTIASNVTIYANATILGGSTVIGEGCVVGGNVFITSSVPPGCTVSIKAPELKYRNRKPAASGDCSQQRETK